MIEKKISFANLLIFVVPRITPMCRMDIDKLVYGINVSLVTFVNTTNNWPVELISSHS